MKLVSIIVPVYNVERYLDECIQSLINQTYKNIEIILVDDGSIDNSSVICDEYANTYSYIKVIHKKNGGLSTARNSGLELARGYYVCYIDSDDKIDVNTIETLVYYQQKFQPDLVECESVVWENGTESLISHYHQNETCRFFTSEEYMKGLLEISCDCSVCNKLFIRDKIKNNKFAEGKTNEDILYLFDVLQCADTILHLNKGFYKYRVVPSSITHTFNQHYVDVFYNSILIQNKIRHTHTSLLDVANQRVLKMAWHMLESLHARKEKHIFPYSNAYNQAKSILWSNILSIIFSSKYKFRSKLGLIYRLLS